MRAIHFLAALAALPGTVTMPSAAAARPPNIVLVMADDLGSGHLGVYGQTKIKTPNIDRLAAEGLRFTQAYAGAPVCAPSRSVLLTGLHAGHTPVRGNLGHAHLADSDVTIAEVLKAAGYATGGYGKWGLGLEDSPGHPLKQGFDDFLGYLHQVHAHFYYPFWLTFNYGRMHLRLNENGGRRQYSHDVIFDRALDFIQKNKDRPFFCYLPVTIPHVELAVPRDSLDEYLGKFPEVGGGQEKRVGYIVSPNPRATFAAMVSRLDRDVGRLTRLLDDLGLARDTVLIFNSDNGGQKGVDVNEEFFNANGDLRGYKGSMYEGGLRIPQIFRRPGTIAPGTVSDHATYFPDMLPTLAELAGADQVPSGDGISIVPTLLGEAGQKSHEWLYWELGDRDNRLIRQGARRGRWKFVRDPLNRPVELYDLESDPAETEDLAARRPDLIAQFEDWLQANRTPPRPQSAGAPVGYRDYVSPAAEPPEPSPLGVRNRPADGKL